MLGHGRRPSLVPGSGRPNCGANPIPAQLRQQQQQPSWSDQLHADSLAILLQQQTEPGPTPPYVSIVRFTKSQSLFQRLRQLEPPALAVFWYATS